MEPEFCEHMTSQRKAIQCSSTQFAATCLPPGCPRGSTQAAPGHGRTVQGAPVLAEGRLPSASRRHGPGPSFDAAANTLIKNRAGANKNRVKNK